MFPHKAERSLASNKSDHRRRDARSRRSRFSFPRFEHVFEPLVILKPTKRHAIIHGQCEWGCEKKAPGYRPADTTRESPPTHPWNCRAHSSNDVESLSALSESDPFFVTPCTMASTSLCVGPRPTRCAAWCTYR